jgi:hypothetical protein
MFAKTGLTVGTCHCGGIRHRSGGYESQFRDLYKTWTARGDSQPSSPSIFFTPFHSARLFI